MSGLSVRLTRPLFFYRFLPRGFRQVYGIGALDGSDLTPRGSVGMEITRGDDVEGDESFRGNIDASAHPTLW